MGVASSRLVSHEGDRSILRATHPHSAKYSPQSTVISGEKAPHAARSLPLPMGGTELGQG